MPMREPRYQSTRKKALLLSRGTGDYRSSRLSRSYGHRRKNAIETINRSQRRLPESLRHGSNSLSATGIGWYFGLATGVRLAYRYR